MKLFNKVNTIEVLQISIIGLMFLVVGSYLSSLSSNIPDNIENEVEQKLPWLKKTSDDITQYMDNENSEVVVSVRSRSFYSHYLSEDYSRDQLMGLTKYLESQGWQKLSFKQFNSLQNPDLPFSAGQNINEKTVVLCKDNATILLWLENLRGRYEHTKDISTSIFIEFNYLSPCYDLNDKLNKKAL